MNHLQTFESFSNEKFSLSKSMGNIGKRMGIINLTEPEIRRKAKQILEHEDELIDIINKSSNPKIHMSNYERLKNGSNLKAFYNFVLFLDKNKSELENGRPVYYKLGDFEVNDIRELSYV